MKKIFFLLLLAGTTATGINAQNTRDIWRNFQVFRIPLKEKLNLPVRKMPLELIRAYCEGSIKAYYPLDTTKECSYHEFIAHFDHGTAQPEGGGTSGQEFSGVPCPQSFCSSNDESLMQNFLVYLELLQVKRFDKNKSVEVTEVKYVRLKYAYMKNDLEVVLDGPVFKYSDIASLAVAFPDRYKIINPKNTAESHSIKKVLDIRMFNGIVLDKFKPFRNETDDKDRNKEKDMWHH